MRSRVAGRGAPVQAAPVPRPPRVPTASRSTFGLAGLFALTLSACGEDQLDKVYEPYEIVGGQPSIDPTRPSVERSPTQAKPGDFASSAPIQNDVFVQRQVSQVDILWVIDNSGSMATKQAKLRTNFTAFMQNLAASGVDYHIGVVTTDIYQPSQGGRLQRGGSGLPQPWIDASCQPPACVAVDKFAQLSAVGISGWGVEAGLLAASLALSPPLAAPGGPNDGFLRPDAALFVVILSDEEDSSCSPAVSPSGCAASVQWGSTDYFTRWFEGLKGFGREDLVTLGAVVGNAPTIDIPSTANVSAVKGCRAADGAPDYAGYAPRYVTVSEATGGIATSICDSSYVQPLQNLGFLATGAKASFTLTRAPVAGSLNVFVTPSGGARTLQRPGIDYDYERCGGPGGAIARNAVRFKPENNALPPALATIEVEYEVNVGGVGACP